MPDDATVKELLELIRGRYFGKYRGVVVQNRDELARKGRLKVKVPAVLGDKEVWAMPCVPMAGKGVGVFLRPPVGAGVWVEFEAGDLDYPIWSGCYWGDGDLETAEAINPMKSFVRTKRVSLSFDDTVGELTIETAGGSKISIGPLQITQEALNNAIVAGPKRIDLGTLVFSVHNGAFVIA